MEREPAELTGEIPVGAFNSTCATLRSSVLTGRRVEQSVAHVCNGYDVTVDGWLIIGTLREMNGLTMSQLAETVVLPAASLSRCVDKLVDESLVYRKANPFDRRQIKIYVSRHGIDLLLKLEDECIVQFA